MKRLIFASLLTLLLIQVVRAQVVEGNLPFELSLEEVASGFSSPTDIANAGDDRLFVLERSGRIRILNEDGSINADPFLDINDRVINSGGQSEQGLLAMEFHHAYENTGWFFVHYSDNDGNTVIARFSVDPNNGNLALPDSEKIIYTAEQPFTNHNGGSIKFGIDKKLYIGLGDGGAANDPQNLAQNMSSPLGKMLRIDIDNGDPFSIPADNPFVNDPNVLDEIWATGLRNPWKFSFDRLNGDMWIADVGQSQWEEINRQFNSSEGGENYGWRCQEGDHDANTSGCNGTYLPPVAEYNHMGFTHCSVTGGYVYRGASAIFKDAPPVYLYADYCSGTFWASFPESIGSDNIVSMEMETFTGRAFGTFGEDMNGELLVAALNNGRIYRINAACNIDVEPIVSQASCDEASDGTISIPSDLVDLFDMQIVDLNNPQATVDADALAPSQYEVTVSRFGCEEVFALEVMIVDQVAFNITFDGISTLTASTTGDSYQWFLDGILLPNQNTQAIEVSTSGVYTVEVTQQSGCVFASQPMDVIISSIYTIKSLSNWQLSPNPVEDNLALLLQTDSVQDFILTLSDSSGKVIYDQQIKVNGVGEFQIDMSTYPSGVYLLMLSDGVAVQTEKFVKQ